MHEFLPCETELPYLCQTVTDGKNAILKNDVKNWTNAVKKCSLRGSFDGSYDLTNPPSSSIKAWTGISRRIINQWSNSMIDSTTDLYDCLAVSKDSASSTVKIHAKTCSDLLPVLCERSDSTIQPSTELTTSEGETTSFEVTNFSDVTTTFIHQKTTVSYLSSSPLLSAEQETKPNDSIVPAIVGGAAAGVIIILLIVFIVLYKRFQQKNSNKVNRHSSGAVYSEINKSRQKSSTGIDGAAEQDGTDDTYDHTVNRKSRQSVHSVQENMYDHTTAPQKEPAEDNFYDSTCRNTQKDTIINDNEYGSVNPATGNDVYSHTNQVFSSSDADVENYDSMNNLK
ncbi:uncharacterized protein LOC134235466 isoform X2 [Saccostrea cucullata]|uniref:uncharacterized protein LOC134235466 isoform X2 n=1 Tax=Saccostrea cuccullata TaxID=36930 RepID=UPI002ED22768